MNITSIGGMVSVPHLLPYNCAKFAAVGLSESLRVELGQEGIRVTTIVPGLMRTGSYLHAIFQGQQEREFTWVALSADLPLTSMSVECTVRQIVPATQRSEAERMLTVSANLLGRLHGLCPGTTSNLLSAVNRLLPGAHAASAPSAPGKLVEEGRMYEREHGISDEDEEDNGAGGGRGARGGQQSQGNRGAQEGNGGGSSRGGTREQHAEAGRQSHKNS